MSELPWALPVALGLSVAIFTWAILCAKGRKNKND